MTYSLYKVRKPRMTKLGQGVGVRAHYPIPLIQWILDILVSCKITISKVSIFHKKH